MGTLTHPALSSTERARALAPLLDSIGREIQERSDALARLLVLRESRPRSSSPAGAVAAACATHRGELRRAHGELERLGCKLISLQPRVFRVEPVVPGAESVLFWCAEEP